MLLVSSGTSKSVGIICMDCSMTKRSPIRYPLLPLPQLGFERERWATNLHPEFDWVSACAPRRVGFHAPLPPGCLYYFLLMIIRCNWAPGYCPCMQSELELISCMQYARHTKYRGKNNQMSFSSTGHEEILFIEHAWFILPNTQSKSVLETAKP